MWFLQDTKEMEFFDANQYMILEVIGKGNYRVVCAHTGEKAKINKVFEHISDALRMLREVSLSIGLAIKPTMQKNKWYGEF